MIKKWANERPFLLSVVVIIIIIIPAFFRIEQTMNRTEEASREAKAVAQRNAQVVTCITTWVKQETAALTSRDIVNETARAAQDDMWQEINRWLKKAPPLGADRRPMINSITRFREVLRRLDMTIEMQPYPDIEKCLDKPLYFMDLMLMVSGQSVRCWGRSATIVGTRKSDVIRGTDGRDVISTGKGEDFILAGKGRDRICTGPGDDMINGAQGFDRARGRRGSDVCIQVEVERSC